MTICHGTIYIKDTNRSVSKLRNGANYTYYYKEKET